MGLSKLTPATACAVLALILLAGCIGSPAPLAKASPPPSPSGSEPPPSPTPPRPPAAYRLTPNQVGLPLVSARDHLGYLEAASEERDQATALELYQTFDWVDQARGNFASGSRSVNEMVLVTLRVAGAHNAFGYWGRLAVKAPLVASPCPAQSGLDQCAEGRLGSRSAAAGRRGVVVFYLVAVGADIDALLTAQAAALSAGPPA